MFEIQKQTQTKNMDNIRTSGIMNISVRISGSHGDNNVLIFITYHIYSLVLLSLAVTFIVIIELLLLLLLLLSQLLILSNLY